MIFKRVWGARAREEAGQRTRATPRDPLIRKPKINKRIAFKIGFFLARIEEKCEYPIYKKYNFKIFQFWLFSIGENDKRNSDRLAIQ